MPVDFICCFVGHYISYGILCHVSAILNDAQASYHAACLSAGCPMNVVDEVLSSQVI